jgi:hypothetical protein
MSTKQEESAADACIRQIVSEADELKPVRLPWPKLSRQSKFLRPGTLAVLGGPTGSGKSFMSLMIGLECHAQRIPWAYLPMESDRMFYLRRISAILHGSFRPLADTEDDLGATEKAMLAVDEVRDRLEDIAPNIEENPTLTNGSGDLVRVTPAWIVQWCKWQFETGKRVAIFDPFAQIDFSGSRDRVAAESALVNDLVNVAQNSLGTIVMVAHLTKSVQHNRPLGMGDLQGGADIGRLAASVILINRHPVQSSRVQVNMEHRTNVDHNRTVYVAKSRNSEGGMPIAFSFGMPAPRFEEHGIILPDEG